MTSLVLIVSVICIIGVSSSPHLGSHQGPSPQGVMSDRSLHVRSLPPITGFQSNIYEVYMEPFPFDLGPIYAATILEPNGGNTAAEGKEDEGSKVEGTIFFAQLHPPNGPVRLSGNITGLKPGKHGFHVHEYGDLRDGCTSCGSHFNPFKAQHGDLTDHMRHIGDLGNIEANDAGVAQIEILNPALSLFAGVRSIMGRSLVVHELTDDLGRAGTVDSVKSGSSGARIACGVVGFVQ